MEKIILTKPVNGEVLREELYLAYPPLAGGPQVPGFRYLEFYSDGLAHWIEVPDEANLTIINSVIAAHSPGKKSKNQQLQETVYQTYSTAVGTRVADLNTNQLKAILTILLYRQGLIDENLRVLPLNDNV